MQTSLFEFANVLITAVKEASYSISKFKEEVEIKYKSDGSEVTQVDTQSQQIIFSIIKNKYPTINIIGEEDVENGIPDNQLPTITQLSFGSLENKIININDIIIYVDPLDGTDCYTHKQYDSVCVLVGVTYKGKPMIGIVSKPFYNNEITFAIENYISSISLQPLNDKIIFVCSKKNDIQHLIKSFPDPYEVKYKGGSGAKMMAIIHQEADIYYHPLIQSCTWDTLAAQVILEAQGGIVCDIYGNPLCYPSSKKESMRHKKGVLCLSPRAKKYLPYMLSISKTILL
ncbi:3'(2'),5'-bisphosphate nucleotidase, putative [Entamoeba histolytica HM-1:IMSS-B]|uniref:Inositol polyphosphate 1-phosphatase n=7 Tax=Entamoeba histolytica TaxID=5759 RepID=INPP_ENTH1|nr:3'(2'),5'-bisphosphate nucleotidase, putative [Entamoeba histolytica HM-1:IMSS]C4M633.1 RecName: Full=Inositol polyphosphate 1-phosphatase; Short=EhIPPase; AltName: Full=3'(2'),5'-bisphosphate nucleotidase [Entamoeba histolytica HM-1:IMSS]EMD43601.1 3'(2'),5'bisphosphate nucleotidase, putative [Entamoeba histolytica KU27]EMH72646.1 3'(2'),5'-bisphosphate nucleotidase, putative [Entamoeba histolytica HM-1:IMSS-B]EMS17663.1 3'(2'),5'-bisphosphate nucleotidase, putative [Entamoeba histolytica H|eukprot:XP_655585.1 3'(2'),5'-bisphosphate nucleotidase, putative [Entamoeba histolytica HM-1:IMSS]